MSTDPFVSCGSGRAGKQPRCPRCALHTALCFCAELVPRTVATRVVVVCHQAEAKKPTNTGRWIPLTLAGGEVRLRGGRLPPLETDDLRDPARRTLLLYPTADSVELTPSDRPVTLVVPDGNWRQARKVNSREPGLKTAERVHLPPGPASRYQLRSHPDPRYVCTFEAVARALGILEGAEVQQHLEEIFERMVQRTLWTRGKLERGTDPTTL